jgi:hypothetical protein
VNRPIFVLGPRAAVAASQSSAGRPVGTEAIARTWAAQDPEAAKAWARTLLPADVREKP